MKIRTRWGYSYAVELDLGVHKHPLASTVSLMEPPPDWSAVFPLAETLPGFSGHQSPQALACGDWMARFLRSVAGPASVRMGAGAGVTAAAIPPGYP